MDRLSAELFSQIGSFLDLRSLCNFALVNKQFHAAATPYLFRTITVKFSSPYTLREAVHRALAFLATTQSFKYVRHLRVIPQHTFTMRHRDGTTDFEGGGDCPWDRWQYFGVGGQETTFVSADAIEWHLLADLVKTRPPLRDLTWACQEVLTPCVLEHIHARPSNCRLHMTRFHLDGLSRPPEDPIKLNAHEVALATSPCLYSKVMQFDYLEEGYVNYNEQAILDMAAGAAPNLREVHLSRQICGSSIAQYAALRVPRQRWQRWQRQFLTSSPATPGSLHSLCLAGVAMGKDVRKWCERTDFSVLRSLRVENGLEIDDLRWLSAHYSFAALECLALRCPDRDSATGDECAEAVEDFISRALALDTVKLMGFYKQRTVDFVLDNLGERLRCLHLPLARGQSAYKAEEGPPKFADAAFIRMLRRKCPLLEDLAICKIRSQGNSDEVAIYQALGSLPRLRKAQLALYCKYWFTWNRNWSELPAGRLPPGEPWEPEELDSALIDLAFDEELARSVFRTVSCSKPSYAFPLERIELRTAALEEIGGLDGGPDLSKPLGYIARSWICTWNPSNDSPQECFIEEYDPEAKLDRQDPEIGRHLSDLDKGPFGSAFRRVWPECQNADWRKVWHSFPLAI